MSGRDDPLLLLATNAAAAADRSQLSWDLVDLDGWRPRDHRARPSGHSWRGSTGRCPTPIASREVSAGRPAADPRVLLALWLLATLDGVGSARAHERMVERDPACRRLAGGDR